MALRECIHCNAIRHPNIVLFLGVYFSSEQSDLPIMVMELMDTGLASFIDDNKSLSTKVGHPLLLAVAVLFLWVWLLNCVCINATAPWKPKVYVHILKEGSC